MGKLKSSTLGLKDVLLISRPGWWLATAVPFAAGYLLTEGGWSWLLTIGAVYFLFAYNLLFYGIGNISDRKLAGRSSLLLVIHAINLPFVIYFATVGNGAAISFLAIMLFMAYAYNVKGLCFKGVPGLDVLASAFVYTSPFIFGVLLAGGSELFLAGWLAFFLWAAASYAFKTIHSIKADRVAGIKTVATQFGAEKVIVFSLGAYLAAAILPVVFYGWQGIPVSLALAAYVALVWRTVPSRSQENSPAFYYSWRKMAYMNYLCGGLVSMYLLYMVGMS